MAQYSFEVEIFYKQVDGDLSECYSCNDTIYGKMYVLCFKVINNTILPTSHVFCQSCYDDYMKIKASEEKR